MAVRGTVWDYEYEDYEEKYDDKGKLVERELVKRKLHLVYNLKALKTYYNFFGSDLMADFSSASFNAAKKLSSMSKEQLEKVNDIVGKVSSGKELSLEDLTGDGALFFTEGVFENNNDFIINATIALIAAGEDTLRSADEIEEELPITVTEEQYQKNLIEFITFCRENSKKNKIAPVWVAA